MTLPDRFWNKVKKGNEEECWLWMGYRDKCGYGRFRWKGKIVSAARLLVFHDAISVKGLMVRHSCDNPACVNPNHLSSGTMKDNMRDKHERGRGIWVGRKGSSCNFAKHDEETIIRLKQEHLRMKARTGRLAKGELKLLSEKFGINFFTMRLILYGKRWPHIKVSI